MTCCYQLPAFLISAAKHDLGDAVGSQFEAVASGEPMENQNSNALTMLCPWIKRVLLDDDSISDVLHSALSDILDEINSYLTGEDE